VSDPVNCFDPQLPWEEGRLRGRHRHAFCSSSPHHAQGTRNIPRGVAPRVYSHSSERYLKAMGQQHTDLTCLFYNHSLETADNLQSTGVTILQIFSSSRLEWRWRSRLVFQRCCVRICVGTLAVLTFLMYFFRHSRQLCTSIRHASIFPNLVQFIVNIQFVATHCSYWQGSKIEQEVLGRTNRLLSFDTTRAA
jgi:hypothetical protein